MQPAAASSKPADPAPARKPAQSLQQPAVARKPDLNATTVGSSKPAVTGKPAHQSARAETADRRSTPRRSASQERINGRHGRVSRSASLERRLSSRRSVDRSGRDTSYKDIQYRTRTSPGGHGSGSSRDPHSRGRSRSGERGRRPSERRADSLQPHRQPRSRSPVRRASARRPSSVHSSQSPVRHAPQRRSSAHRSRSPGRRGSGNPAERNGRSADARPPERPSSKRPQPRESDRAVRLPQRKEPLPLDQSRADEAMRNDRSEQRKSGTPQDQSRLSSAPMDTRSKRALADGPPSERAAKRPRGQDSARTEHNQHGSQVKVESAEGDAQVASVSNARNRQQNSRWDSGAPGNPRTAPSNEQLDGSQKQAGSAEGADRTAQAAANGGRRVWVDDWPGSSEHGSAQQQFSDAAEPSSGQLPNSAHAWENQNRFPAESLHTQSAVQQISGTAHVRVSSPGPNYSKWNREVWSSEQQPGSLDTARGAYRQVKVPSTPEQKSLGSKSIEGSQGKSGHGFSRAVESVPAMRDGPSGKGAHHMQNGASHRGMNGGPSSHSGPSNGTMSRKSAGMKDMKGMKDSTVRSSRASRQKQVHVPRSSNTLMFGSSMRRCQKELSKEPN